MAKGKKKGFFGRVYNVSKWTDADNIKKTGKSIISQAKRLTEVRESTRKETFEQAIARMNITEKDLKDRMKQTYLVSWIFLALAIGLLGYGSFVFMRGFVSGLFICVVMSVLGFVLAYQQSFWYFQMKRRKLGCTFNEWVNFIFRKG